MVFRRRASTSDIPTHSSTQVEKPQQKGRFRSASVSSQKGTSYIGSSSGDSKVATKSLSNRDVRHVAMTRFFVKLCSLVAGRNKRARNYVVDRSKDLVHKVLQTNDSASRAIAHKLIDNLGNIRSAQCEELSDWRCSAYSQLGQQYSETGEIEQLATTVDQMEAELSQCSALHSPQVRSNIAGSYQALAEKYMRLGTIAGNKQAGHYIANIPRFSTDDTVTQWGMDQAKRLLSGVTTTSTDEARNVAVTFIREFEKHAQKPSNARVFLQPHKTTIAPTVFATDHLASSDMISLKADNSIVPERVVVYGRNSFDMSRRIEETSGTTGEVKSEDNAYKSLSLSSGTLTVMATEPVQKDEAALVAKKLLDNKAGVGNVTANASESTEYLMSQLHPSNSDRILFNTDISTPITNTHQWQSDLHNFAVMLNCEAHNKHIYWSKVRFLINCDGLTNPTEISIRRQGIINDVNKLLAPVGLQMDEGHFIMTAENSSDLPEAYRQDLPSQFAPSPTTANDTTVTE